MFVDEIIKESVRETKDLIRERISNTAESVFEDERRKGYAEGAIEFGEEIEQMVVLEKEQLRNNFSRDLSLKRSNIITLWETVINRTTSFQIWFEIVIRLTFFIALFSLLFSAYRIAIIFGIFTAISFIVSVVPGLFQTVMFISTGCCQISDRLLMAYYQYGRIEAALYFADYRDISKISETQKHWIYTTSHKTASPE